MLGHHLQAGWATIHNAGLPIERKGHSGANLKAKLFTKKQLSICENLGVRGGGAGKFSLGATINCVFINRTIYIFPTRYVVNSTIVAGN
jgi:hypothetical protein